MISKTHKRVTALLAVLTVVTGCGGGFFNTPNPGGSGGSGGSGTTPSTATQVFDLTNQERTNAGLAALTWNNQLATAAENHAQDMIDRSFFDHTSPPPNSTTVRDRATAAGYSWSLIGENIAKGQTTPADVMTAWMNSTGHRDNILRGAFTEIGIGVRTDSTGAYYWVQVFGTPTP